MSKCLSCIRGFHSTCRSPCDCDHKLGVEVVTITSDTETESALSTGLGDEGLGSKRRLKRDQSLKDQQSTGRKRAARLYKLDRTAPCEWVGLRLQGGGTSPIDGCGLAGRPAGKQQARHHGPDKNTLNNEEGNVHRICHLCHNRWHAANDPNYDVLKGVRGD